MIWISAIYFPASLFEAYDLSIIIACIAFFAQLWKKFRGDEKPPAFLGSSKEYNVDMVPKVNCACTLRMFFCIMDCKIL